MNVHTHWLGGALAGIAAAAALPGHPLVTILAAVAAAPLPDIDHPGSTYGRWVPLPGVARVRGRIEPYRPGPAGNAAAAFGHVGRVTPFGIGWHRGGMHSVTVAAACALACGAAARALHPGWGLAVGIGVLGGLLSHEALDALNGMGQAWFWPFTGRRWGLPWPRIRVGSGGEAAVTFALVALLAVAGWRFGPLWLAGPR